MPNRQIALLVSGGPDSAVLIRHFLKTFDAVFPVYIQSGHVWEKAELYWLKRFLKAVRSPKLKPLTRLIVPTGDLCAGHWSQTGNKIPGAKRPDEDFYLPGRNILLISKVSVFCALHRIHHLGLGVLKTNPFPDATKEFFKLMECVAAEGLRHRLKIHAPLHQRTKIEVLKMEKDLPFELTFSCLSPVSIKRSGSYLHCGRCGKCAERKTGFRQVGIQDPIKYAG